MKGHIRQRGKNSYELKFDAGRDPVTGERRIQYHSFRGTKRQAQDKLSELLAAVGKRDYVEPSKLTVAEHLRARVAQWEAARLISPNEGISPKTAERYRELIENQITPHIGAKQLQKLRAPDIEAWHTTLATGGRKDGKGGLSGGTIVAAHRLLSQALREAARHDLVNRNAAIEEGAPKIESDEVVILDDEQVNMVVAKLKGRSMYAPAIMSLFSGMRRGELLAARWSNVNLDAKPPIIEIREALEETKAQGIRFKQTKTKSGRRDVSLPDIVVEVLREHRRQQLELRLQLGLGRPSDDALLFPIALGEGPQSPREFSRKWQHAADSIGVGAVTFHALRHTHASQLIDAGIDVVKISKRLGHANPKTTLGVYAHLFRKREDKAADAINDAINKALIGGKSA